jgi:hypothetical protein
LGPFAAIEVHSRQEEPPYHGGVRGEATLGGRRFAVERLQVLARVR